MLPNPGPPRMIFTRTAGTSEQTKNEYIGLKGDQEPLLRVYRQIGHNAELIDKDSTVKNHDILQIAYCASGETYGVIFSIDGRGVVTLHFPERSDGEALLNQAGEIPIPHAYEIDDAPDFERFFLVSSRTDINVAEVLAAGYELAGRPDAACDQRLELTDQYRQTSLIIRKENEQ